MTKVLKKEIKSGNKLENNIKIKQYTMIFKLKIYVNYLYKLQGTKNSFIFFLPKEKKIYKKFATAYFCTF